MPPLLVSMVKNWQNSKGEREQMIEVKKMAAQGDVLFRRLPSLPKSAVAKPTNGSIVVAHSETGHHHSIDRADGVQFFTEPSDPLICYLQLDGVAHVDVVHHRAWDPHDTLRLLGTPKKKTVFEIRRQREYSPQGWRRVED
jgi:hypothetical protein